ncbi:MAG: exodeoxyribonuclease V subunit alpha, partial [Burkholderiales bacterium]
APTGKAAARLAQSLAEQLARLDPSGELRARLPAAGQTVHRLLGSRADSRSADPTPLDHDLVIVDEASMLDIELAARLFESLGPGARLVLAGDRDQLASVEAGAVFADLCSASLDGVIVLERNYRQQDAPDIVALAAQIREAAGRAGAADASPHAIDWPEPIVVAPAEPAQIVDQALAAWHDAFAAIAADAEPAKVLEAYDRHRVLAAMRDGPLGVQALNRAIALRVRRLAAGGAAADWYAGRLVMVTKNEPGLGLFNGDVGVCLPPPDPGLSRDGLVVAFGAADRVRLFPVLQVPACEDAWAMTVHKSQGSEFGSVALVPAPAGHPLNTRELVYTGVTRARSRLCIYGSRDAIEEAARRPTERHGRLAARLAGLRGQR